MLGRRELIKAGAALVPLVIAGRAFAAPEAAGTRLLVVFLRGAYDAANVIAPTGSSFYYEARPTLALAKPDPANPAAASSLDADWSLHPALKDSILPFWKKKQIAFIPFAGTDDMSRSHFETQDTIELGQSIGGHRNYGSGFMGRLAAAIGGDRAISFTSQLPLCFRGGPTVANIAMKGSRKSAIAPEQARAIEAMYRGEQLGPRDLGQSVAQGFQIRDTVFTSLRDEMAQSGRGAASTQGFEKSARQIGVLMKSKFNLAFVDVGGWDTHVRQGNAQGYLADRIGELGRGLAGFADEIGPDAWRNTTVIVVSEFGRAFRENGDKGTDHGHGSVYWVMGGGVHGGRMAGPQVRLSQSTLNQGRDLPVMTDYRGLIGGVVARQFGLGRDRLQTVFPDAAPQDLMLI